MQITIRKKRYTLRWVPRLKDKRGDCDPPHGQGKTIRIEMGQDEHLEFDTLIHEFLHAGLWDIDEEAVEQLATDMARTLWKLGYRRSAAPGK